MSVVGLGTWQLRADRGDVEEDALAVLDAAVESAVTFFYTADVYGDGRSEQLIGQYLHRRPDADVLVATRTDRRVELDPVPYTLDSFRA